MWNKLSYFIPPNYRLSRVRRICWRRRRIFFLAEKKTTKTSKQTRSPNPTPKITLIFCLTFPTKKLYFVYTSKSNPVEISTFGRAFSLCSRCNNPHVYHVNVAFTLKIYQISGLTNTFCAHKYFSDLITKFDIEQICFSGVVLSLEIISEAWRSLAVGAHFDIITIVFDIITIILISSLLFCFAKHTTRL